MKKWLTRIVVGTLALVILLSMAAVAMFLRWRQAIAEHLEDGSTIVVTPRGPVEYAVLGTGRPVLYLHGSPGGFDQVYRVLRVKYGDAGPGFQAIIPSRPGYLRTPLSTGTTPAQQADAMAALLDVLKIQHVAVVGISAGGPSALQIALRYPARCTALVLWSAVTQRIVRQPPLMLRLPLTDVIVWGMLQIPDWALQRRLKNDPTAAAITREVVKGTVPFARRRAGSENDWINDSELPAWPLREVHCPTLVIHGTGDGAVPFAHAEAAHAQIPGSRLMRLEGGHAAGFTQHLAVDAAIRTFLNEHETPPHAHQ